MWCPRKPLKSPDPSVLSFASSELFSLCSRRQIGSMRCVRLSASERFRRWLSRQADWLEAHAILSCGRREISSLPRSVLARETNVWGAKRLERGSRGPADVVAWEEQPASFYEVLLECQRPTTVPQILTTSVPRNGRPPTKISPSKFIFHVLKNKSTKVPQTSN